MRFQRAKEHKQVKVIQEDLRAGVHPENVLMGEAIFQQAMCSGTYFYEARMRLQDDSFRWIAPKGKVYFDGQNNAVRMPGAMRVINEEKINGEKLPGWQRLSALRICHHQQTTGCTITSRNESAERMIGFTEEEI